MSNKSEPIALTPDADRAKATERELVSQIAGMIGCWYPQASSDGGGALLAECIVGGPIAAARAAARAPYDRLTADLRKLADEWEQESWKLAEQARLAFDTGRASGFKDAASRLRAVAEKTKA